MRRFFILSTLFLMVLAALGIAGGVALAAAAPFHAGQMLYPVQRLAEQSHAALQENVTAEALYQMNLLERRVTDLALVTGTPHESAALDEVYRQLQITLRVLGQAPKQDTTSLKASLSRVLDMLQQVLPLLVTSPGENEATYRALYNETQTLAGMLGDTNTPLSVLGAMSTDTFSGPGLAEMADVNSPAGNDMQTGTPLSPQAVVFPPGSIGAQHAFYPLTGAHSTLDCTACHGEGQYAGTSSECAVCHRQSAPGAHFSGDCAACHSPTTWADVHFNHQAAGATDCQACHSKSKPAKHFGGQCSQCHSVTAWRPANFNHQAAGATDCKNCHSKDKPSGHFGGQCSQCHNTAAWVPAHFTHSFPLEHGNAGGTCSKCHPNDPPKWTCYTCHDRNRMEEKHNEEGINDIAGRCLQCHPDGEEGD